jgi:hypothetical protein
MISTPAEGDEKKLNIFNNAATPEDSGISIRTEQQPAWNPAEELTARTKYFYLSFDL